MTIEASANTTIPGDQGPVALPDPGALVAAPPREVFLLLGSIAATALAMAVAVLGASSALDAAGVLAMVTAAAFLVGAIALGRRAAGLSDALGGIAHPRAVAPVITLGNSS